MHTQQLNPDGSPKYLNALIKEDSPYLRQHAHNPVNWYPWGEEAFARAKAENKPIFLSIGYSTCHWCHVMARESFDDEEIAELLNQSFISIKVDREQRPDIDEIYMTGVQLISGRGGWPMSNFLTPEGKPFFGATYFPPEQFSRLLSRLAGIWASSEARVRQEADVITGQIDQLLAAEATAELSSTVMEKAVAAALEMHDPVGGGFGDAPKFPSESLLMYLLDQLSREDDPELLSAVAYTLDAMARGGVYDQVGGGFHRYSVDSSWQVPHFEKMLYNQALLARVYTRAHILTGDAYYAVTARETLDYALRDMRDSNGCFYSATDADSEGEEGLFFLWTARQIDEHLDAGNARWVRQIYGISEPGSFEGRNILHLTSSIPDIASRDGQTAAQVYQRLAGIKQQLRDVREQRVHPPRDEKMITAWNAMTITSLVEAGRALSDDRYLQAAEQCAQHLYREQWNPREGVLWRISWKGSSSVTALQEDYAWLVEAFIALYDATASKLWLDRAEELAQQMTALFWDEEHGGYFAGAEGGGLPPPSCAPKVSMTTRFPPAIR